MVPSQASSRCNLQHRKCHIHLVIMLVTPYDDHDDDNDNDEGKRPDDKIVGETIKVPAVFGRARTTSA